MRPSPSHDKILISPILHGPCTGNDSYSKLLGTMALSYKKTLLYSTPPYPSVMFPYRG